MTIFLKEAINIFLLKQKKINKYPFTQMQAHKSGRHISSLPRNRLLVRIIAADTAQASPCLVRFHA